MRRGGGRLIGGLKWSSREKRSPLASVYFRKGNRREGKKENFLREAEKSPFLVESSTYKGLRDL